MDQKKDSVDTSNMAMRNKNYLGNIFLHLDWPAFPCKLSLLVLHFICISLRSVRASELRSEYFSALTAQSVNKCLLSYALMHLHHLFPTATNNFKNFTLPNFFEHQNVDAWLAFLISEGSKERLIFLLF